MNTDPDTTPTPTPTPGTTLRNIATAFALFAATMVVAFAVISDLGWYGAVLIWPLHLFGLAAIVVGVRAGATKWLLLAAPVFLIPLALFAMLMLSCAQGDCL